MTPDWWRSCLAEGIATFGLTFISAGAICANQYSGGELGLLGIALAQATALMCMVYATAHVSGGHVNPAVSVAAFIVGKIPAPMAALYIGAQLTGAAIAGFVLAGLYTPDIWQPVNLGTPTLSPEVAFSTGVFIEALLSFFLVFTILQVAVDERGPDNVYGLAIGFVLLFAILVGGPLTGAAVNPARAFGPALASGSWANHAVYWVGPMTGGLAGALAYTLLQPTKRE